MQKNSVNKVFLIGHLGSNPEARYTKTGRATATFSVATNEAWKQKNGNNVEHTEWHSIVTWDKLAEFAQQYLAKGQLVSIEGRIYTRQWKNKEGQKGKTTEIICSNIVPLEWKKTITT
jgi:single-strand DNA-binding protein